MSSGQNAGSGAAESKRGEYIAITASLENVSDREKMFHEFSANDETQGNIPDKVSEFLVPGTHFDEQWLTHHINAGSFFCVYGCLIA